MQKGQMENKLIFRAIEDTCRLCISNFQLVSVFDQFDVPKPFSEIVAAITSVKITKEDKVSQKMCHKCVSIVIKTYQFREQAIRNDESLKAKYAKLTKSQPEKTRPANTTETIFKCKDEVKTEDVNLKVKATKVEKPHPYIVHPSVTAIFKKYPTMRIPTVCINSNISPTVVMKMDEVENYFRWKRSNLNIQHDVNIVTKEKQVARKSTSIIASTSKNVVSRNVLCEENCNNSKNIDVLYTTNRKRKLSDSSSSSHQSAKKPLLDETAGTPVDSSPSPVPSTLGDNISELSFARSEKLHVCNICNSVYSGASNLRKHKFKHLRCQFCKKKFKTFVLKDTHVKNDCKIQKILKSMVNLPDIPLQKIECNVKIRDKFRKAFAAFNLIPKEDANRLKSRIPNTGQTKVTSDIIEILSDEDEGECEEDSDSLFTEIIIKDKFIEGLKTDTDSDTELLQNLLSQCNTSNKKVCESTQTNIPTKSSITFNHANSSIQLKFLKSMLNFHQIPICVNYGSCFKISYKRTSEIVEKKKLHHWNDLTCCDINFNDTSLEELDSINVEVTPDIITYDDTAVSTEDEILVEDIYARSVPIFYKIPEKTTDAEANKTSADSQYITKGTCVTTPDQTKNSQDEKSYSKKSDVYEDIVVIEDDAEVTEVLNSEEHTKENKINNTTKLDITGESVGGTSSKTKQIKFIAKYYTKDSNNTDIFYEESDIVITTDLPKTNTLVDHKAKDPSVEKKCTENKKSTAISDKMTERVSLEVKQACYEVIKEKSNIDKINIQSDCITKENDTESEKETSNNKKNNQNSVGVDQDGDETLEQVLNQTNLEKDDSNHSNVELIIKKMSKNVDETPNKTSMIISGTADKNLKKNNDNAHTKETNKRITKNLLLNRLLNNRKDVGQNSLLTHNIELIEDLSKDLTNEKIAENTNSNNVDKKTSAQTEIGQSDCEIVIDKINETMNKDNNNIDIEEKSYKENILGDIIVIDDNESSEETVHEQIVKNGVDSNLDYCVISDEELDQDESIKETIDDESSKKTYTQL
ncbi:unnamed protein product [Diabrotica balteata]|uniref:ZAD domain-containing protein n=1 Tax=Diabrotica balteata TaxID=107213 RepID=A0A9N9XHB5_DIABA|nr:unnamed protein product [Diabrotica balteata]